MSLARLIPRLLLWATAALGAGTTLAIGVAWALRPSVPPDDVDAIRLVATYRYTPLDVRWQGLPLLGRWSDVEGAGDALEIRRTRAFTRTKDFEIDLP